METKQIESDQTEKEPYNDNDYKTNILIHREKLLSTRAFDNYYRKFIKTKPNNISK